MPPATMRRVAGEKTAVGVGNRRKPPKEVSLTDPQAAWVARPGIDPLFAYDANYLVDNKAGIIVDAEGTRAKATLSTTEPARKTARPAR